MIAWEMARKKDKLLDRVKKKSEISWSHYFLGEAIHFGLICHDVYVNVADDSKYSVWKYINIHLHYFSNNHHTTNKSHRFYIFFEKTSHGRLLFQLQNLFIPLRSNEKQKQKKKKKKKNSSQKGNNKTFAIRKHMDFQIRVIVLPSHLH